MANYCWLTDIHLDTLGSEAAIVSFANSIVSANPDGVIITGDISIAKHLTYHLSIMEGVLRRPINFVLGNHDFYGSSIERIRSEMKELTNMSQYIKYIPSMPYVQLSNNTALVGHDGWYDALYGDWKSSRFVLNDWSAIADFAAAGSSHSRNMAEVVAISRKIAHECVLHVHNGIKTAQKNFRNIIVATHVPPFDYVHVHKGRPGEPSATPFYTSKMMGDMLLAASKAFPKTGFTVLCGHTHGRSSKKIENNLTVHVGSAEYGAPTIEQMVTVV